jgi:hypothetical protein
MASLTHEIEIDVTAETAWDVVRDFAALHTRLVPGFVANVEVFEEMDGPVRRVSFAHGIVLVERIVSIDDGARRFVWSIRAEGIRHHNGALHVISCDTDRCKVEWTADVLPHELADRFSPLMKKGLATMRATLEAPVAA